MLQPLRVLLVEDNPDDAELVLRELRRAGFKPDWQRVETASDYMDRLPSGFDIILSDYAMPEFSGPQALELLKQSGFDIPFVIISGTIGEEVAVEVMRLGATDYLLKDRLGRLGNAVERALLQKRLQTEHKRTEISLRLFRALVDRSSDGIAVVNAETGRFLDINETFCHRVGYERGELLSMRVPDVQIEAVTPLSWPEWAEEMRQSGFKLFEGRHRRKDGSSFPVEVNIRHVALDHDYMLAIVRDITERKQVEEALRWKTTFLEAQVNATIDGIIVVDAQGRKILQNQRTADIFKIPQSIAEDKDDTDQLQWVTNMMVNPASFIEGVQHLYAHPDEVGRDEVELKDGTILDRYSSPVVGKDGKYYGRIWTFRDITDRKRDAAALLESKRFLQSTLNALTSHIAILDERGTIIEVNAAWNRFASENDFLGAYRGVGDNYLQICDSASGRFSEEAVAVGAGIRAVMAGQSHEFHLEYPCHSLREQRWFVVRVTRFDGEGLLRVVVAHENITERKLAEDAMRESEERFRQLAENIKEVFWITNASLDEILYVSPAYETIWGRTCASLYAAPWAWLEAIHPDDRDHVHHAVTSRQMNGTYNEEYRIIRADGSIRWIRDRAFPVCNARGAVYRIVGIAKDITHSKLVEDQLREQASLLDKARDAIMVRDLDHGITYWNKSAERLYGWSAEEVKGGKASDLLYKDLVEFEKAVAAVMRDGMWHGEIQQITKVGNPILVEGRWTLVRDAAGRPQSILAINSDITEKKKLEQQFLRAQRMESIGTLAGGIAHDLNNVLAPIMMSIELLRMTSRDERAKSMLTTIETSARRGADMVQQILSFARGMEGQHVLISPRQIIEEMQHLVQDTFPKNIAFHTDLSPVLPAFLGDHTQVHQVLLNLCVNARDAMPGGGTLTLSARSRNIDEHYATMHLDAKPGAHVMIQVTDTGTGIPPEVVEKIFDPFFTTKELGKGTGLGLSTVHTIVKNHGGFLNVESEPGNGTTFTVYFPANAAAAGQTVEIHADTNPRGNGELILIVDDEAAVRTITQQTLEAFGYRVLLAADGTEALTLYAQHQTEVAVVLTDMMMPIMDGPATIQVLKHMNPSVKIIAASGITNDGGAARAAGMGVKHFLPKPYTAQTVLMTLHRVLHDSI